MSCPYLLNSFMILTCKLVEEFDMNTIGSIVVWELSLDNFHNSTLVGAVQMGANAVYAALLGSGKKDKKGEKEKEGRESKVIL
jgi:hypothetical protein